MNLISLVEVTKNDNFPRILRKIFVDFLPFALLFLLAMDKV